MTPSVRRLIPLCLAVAAALGYGCRPGRAQSPPLNPPTAHTLQYAPGKSISLDVPGGFDITVAASGLRRVRFFAQAPDGRIFATGMYNLADNTQGTVYLLGGWDAKTGAFTHITHYLDHLRNPNNLAFWTDPRTKQSWLYLPLTDRLLRYKYTPGDEHPTSAPEVLMRFPDYGLNYKYGGWHLTRTVAVATLQGQTRVYLTAGSSCNYCLEREVLRAALVSMKPDGSDQRIEAQGLRNAVDLKFVPDVDGGALFATDMGDDHLGDKLPEDTFFELDSNEHFGPIAGSQGREQKTFDPTLGSPLPNYGWPTCYFANGKPVHDTTPLPAMPPPGDLRTQSERPADAGDSSYGAQPDMVRAGVNLPAGGKASVPDPDAQLGKPPAPLADCKKVPAAYTTFAAHSSPLGLAYFGADDSLLRGSFLVALHGAGHPRIGTGYRVVRLTQGNHAPRDFITGFLTFANGKPVVHGRPCGLLRLAPDTFLLTDDYLGLIYYIHPASQRKASS